MKPTLDRIEKDLKEVKEMIAEEIPPEHFGAKDVIYSFLGALVIGLTFMFKGLLIQAGINLRWENVILIVLTTLLILTFEIYFIGYSRVKHKERRPFLQFWAKRLISIYVISIAVSFMLAYLFGINYMAGNTEVLLKIIFAVSMPCAIGAAFTDLLKRGII
jgi:uncharacterized membrane protein